MKDVRLLLTLIITWMITQVVVAFVPSPSTTNNNNKASSSSISSKLNFGFNGLGTPNDEKKKNKTKDSSTATTTTTTTTTTQNEEKKITTKGLFQLIAAGMGAPFLGDYEGVDNDGKMMFTLEANNLVDENGNSKQTQMPYFENGWVEEEDESQIAKKKKNGSSSSSGFKFPWQQ